MKRHGTINESFEEASIALAEELGLDESDLQDKSGEYEHYEPDYTFGVKLPDGNEATYIVYDNEESARTAAIDDLGEVFQDESPILGAAINHFDFSTFSDYINGLDEEDLEDLESLSEEMNGEEFAEYIQNNFDADYRGFAELNIDALDPAWHLAIYDGREIELANGMVAYRVE